ATAGRRRRRLEDDVLRLRVVVRHTDIHEALEQAEIESALVFARALGAQAVRADGIRPDQTGLSLIDRAEESGRITAIFSEAADVERRERRIWNRLSARLTVRDAELREIDLAR